MSFLIKSVKAENHGRQIQGILAALNHLLEMTRQRDFGDGSAALSAFDRAFGPKPTGRGKDIPPLQISGGKVKPEEVAMPAGGGTAANQRPAVRALEMEMESVRRYDESYRLLHIEITPAECGSTMGPVQAHAATMIRQEEIAGTSVGAGHPSAALVEGKALGGLVTDKGIQPRLSFGHFILQIGPTMLLIIKGDFPKATMLLKTI